MLRWFGAVVLLAAVVALVLVHGSYGLDYVVRVYVHQESSPDDYRWKPSVRLRASAVGAELVRQPDPLSVRVALEADSRIQNLDAFLHRTGSTALIVAKERQVIFEGHYNGHQPGELVPTFSASKSVFSALVGRAVDRGYLAALDDAITRYVPELADRDHRFNKITLAHLIDMRSGLSFHDEVTFPFFDADKPLVYYATDLRRTLLTRTRISREPGSFHYGDYDPNLLALALERGAKQPWQRLLQTELWDALGARHDALWSTDQRGFPMVESGLAAAPVDLARLGIAMLDSAGPGGLVSTSWHERSTLPLKPLPDDTGQSGPWHYQNGWWLLPRREGPADFCAIGRFGQYVYVSPAHRVVIVRTGIDRGGLQDTDFIEIFFAAAERLGQSP